MFRPFTQIATAIGLGLLLSGVAQCQSRWEFSEIFSTADGSIQFVVFALSSGCCEELPVLAGQTLVASDGRAEHRLTFAYDVKEYGDFEGQRYSQFLVATQGFADLNLVKPDFVVPNGFLFLPGGYVRLGDTSLFRYDTLPADGWRARWGDTGAIGQAVATNNASELYLFPPTNFNALGPGLTGSWFSLGQSGHGFMLEVLPGTPGLLVAAWLVFSPGGGASWIFGLGPNNNPAVLQAFQMAGAGARFPPDFDPSQVHQEDWGTLTFTFSDCNHARIDWTSTMPGYGSGGTDLVRLTLPAGLTCP